MLNFSQIYHLKCVAPKNKGRTNFYERCDFKKKYILRCSDMRPGWQAVYLVGRCISFFFKVCQITPIFHPLHKTEIWPYLRNVKRRRTKIDAYFFTLSRQKFAFLLQRVTRKSNELLALVGGLLHANDDMPNTCLISSR